MSDDTNIQDLAAKLTFDGAETVELGDGSKLRLSFVPDSSNPFDEVDCYGRVEATARHNERRPDGFNGNAEILNGGGYEAIWWQPPADAPRRCTPEFASLRTLVLELIEYGYQGVVVEHLQGEDAYHRPIVVDVASLWGVEPSPTSDYLYSIVTDLIAEVL
jgi:hypothetical protein